MFLVYRVTDRVETLEGGTYPADDIPNGYHAKPGSLFTDAALLGVSGLDTAQAACEDKATGPGSYAAVEIDRFAIGYSAV